MQTKTRLTALLLGLVLIFCLSACQKAPAETADAPAQTIDNVIDLFVTENLSGE